MATDFQDFLVEVEPAPSKSYQARVLSAPMGGGECELHLPFAVADLPKIRREIEAHVRQGDPAAQRALEDLGAMLFDALFQGPVRDSYLASRGCTDTHRGAGLRLRLTARTEAVEILSLPWELLYRKETREFVARSHLHPLVRYVPAPRASSTPRDETLRILVAWAAPRTHEGPDAEAEVGRLREALQSRRDVAVEPLPNATIEGLQRVLSTGFFDVLHFIGHGFTDPTSREGFLVLENGRAGAAMVAAAVLADLVRSHRSLRLVYLSSCEGAVLPVTPGLDSFQASATALVLAGVPTVIAMQFPVSNRAAQALSTSFYEALADGDPPDTALAKARHAFWLSRPTSCEWITPTVWAAAVDDSFTVRPEPCHQEENTPRPALHDVVHSEGVFIGQRIQAGDVKL